MAGKPRSSAIEAMHTSVKGKTMQGEPTAYRIVDPGIRALFTEASRFQAWLDVEAALAQAQAELGIIPQPAAEEITRKAQLAFLDMDAIRSGLARTGHPLVPLIWELDRVCDGDAGGYVHWGRRRRTSPRRACCCCYGRRMTFFCSNWRPCWTCWPIWPSAPSRCSFPAHAWPACCPSHVWL